MKSIIFVLSCFCLLTTGCSQTTETDNPDWVESLIMEFKSQPVGNPPQSIWQYKYKGQIVYYVPPQCCDQPSTLYDKKGNVLGAPDGGFSGRGDGRFTDFFTERKNEKLIWKDSRQ
ncbi:MAG: hypothetical protein ABIG69_13730 [Bacteroidota bacterium]